MDKLEAYFTFNVICITYKHILEMALWEGIPTVFIQIGMNGTIFAAGTVGPCLTLTSKSTPLDPRYTLYVPRFDLLDIAHMSL